MFKKTMTTIGAGVALAAAGVLASGTAAFAHECFNPNRSAQASGRQLSAVDHSAYGLR